MIEKIEIIAIYDNLQKLAKEKIRIPKLSEVAIKNFFQEEKFLFLEIAENIIEFIESGQAINDYLDQHKKIINRIKMVMEELSVNKEVFNLLLAIQKKLIDAELAKLYLAKILYA